MKWTKWFKVIMQDAESKIVIIENFKEFVIWSNRKGFTTQCDIKLLLFAHVTYGSRP
jgi:hypothetical protein